MKKRFIIGSRGSELALKQSRSVCRMLRRSFPNLSFAIRIVKTKGDLDKSLSVFNHADTGVFTRAIEERLLEGDVDFAVHCLKDLPTSLPRGLRIGAYLRREDPRDTLVTKAGFSLTRLERRATLGTTSLRRARQLLLIRPDLRIVPLRGNLGTRVSQVLSGRLDGIVIAQAGVNRLGRYARLGRPLKLQTMLPCVGQGILAVEIRSGDADARAIASKLNHRASEIEAIAERSFLAAMRGGCRVPIGALARARGARLSLDTVVLSTRTSDCLRGSRKGKSSDAARIGRTLAASLLKKGAGKFLDEARDL